jgi:hypothetical protein
MSNGMSWLAWCPDVPQIKHRYFNNEYLTLKIPGGKKILFLFGLMLRSNQFCKCAMTLLVPTNILDKFQICDITPEGEALMLNLYDTALIWYPSDPQYNKIFHHYHVSFHYCHQTPISFPLKRPQSWRCDGLLIVIEVVMRLILLAPNPCDHEGIGNPYVTPRIQKHTV